jgi:hypothetical protein
MKTFTIENETSNITAHPTKNEASEVPDAESFSSAEELATLAANWPAPRLIEIWNSLPGVAPVKKFTDRRTAATRIWKAIQSLGETVIPEPDVEPQAEQAEPAAEQPDAPAAEPATQQADAEAAAATEVQETTEPAAPPEEAQPEAPASEPAADVSAQGPDVAPEGTPATKKATRKAKTPTSETFPKAPREGSKTGQVIAMLKREGGTTLEEIMTAMGWQKHTTRAMLSAGGSLTKNHGLVVISEMVGEKRTYSIKG